MLEQNKVFPKKKYSLLNAQGVSGIKPTYMEEGHKPTICGEHIVLANMLNEAELPPELKRKLLSQVDVVYDMGKRMGNKLQDYHRKFVEGGHGWREGF